MVDEKLRNKLAELIARAPSLSITANVGVNKGAAHAFVIEAKHIIELVVPSPFNAYRTGLTSLATLPLSEGIETLGHILVALKRDLEAGLLSSLENKVKAETFDDFLEHAVAYRRDGRKNEAGVIAGVVFEDTIRRLYSIKIGNDKGRKLEDIINELTKSDVLTALQSKQAKVTAHVRTKATHAQWDEFDMHGVDDTIQFTKRLIADHLDK